MSTEAMKLALDNLIAEYYMENSSFAKRVDDIFKEVPAQPQQEPVLMFYEREWQGKTSREYQWLIDPFSLPAGTKLYTSPPAQRKPLTDEEIKQFASKHLDVGDGSYATHFVTGDVAFARAIEAAHGIKGDA